MESDNEINAQAVGIADHIIDAVRNAPLGEALDISGLVKIDAQITKVNELTVHAISKLELQAWSTPYVVLAAKNLYIEVPAAQGEIGEICRAPDSLFPPRDGAPGAAGAAGWTSGMEDGRHGGDGGDGATGAQGGRADVPDLIIFFQNIKVSGGNPAISGFLNIHAEGVAGGAGGRGGRGGDGGTGAKGQSARTGSFLGVPTCEAGPGGGGNGGKAGSGGKGGTAGLGGRGGKVFFVGPEAVYKELGMHFRTYLQPGPPGPTGLPGDPGTRGHRGDAGDTAPPCGHRDGGDWGAEANPRDLGPGDPAGDEGNGARYPVYRNNSDLF